VLLMAAACDGDLAALGRVTESAELLDHLAPAEEMRLVQVVDRTVRFRHPLARAAAYSAATTADRTRAHTLLATAYADDPGRQIWHRAEATVVPDEEVAAGLAAVAALAQHRSAIVEAARLLVRAAELSPSRADRDARMLEAAMMNTGAGHFEWVVQVCTRLRDESDDQEVQVRASHLMAYALAQTGDQAQARATLVDVLEKLLTLDPATGWTSLTTLAVLVYRAGDDVRLVADWLERYERADVSASPFGEVVPAARAWLRMQIAPLSRPADVLELVRDAPVPDYPLGLVASHEMLLGAAAWLLDEPEIAMVRLGRSVELMQSGEASGQMTQTLLALSLVQFAVGYYDAADDSGRLVLDIAEAGNQSYAMVDGREVRARVAGIRGDIETARELCDLVLLHLRPGDSLSLEANVRITMSRVRLAERDTAGAWDQLRWLFREDGEPRHEHISYRELGHYVATAVRAGAAAEVAPVLAVAAERLAGSGPRHRLDLARARALVAGEDAEPFHRHAVTDREAPRWPFELANAQLEYGAWLRRRHRQTEARAQLQAALDVFDRLGTPVWAEMTRAELRAAGVATAGPDDSAWAELTGQERQVVRLAASGLTNPEIAASLYLSPRTVSTHLYNAFPKLGVTSRVQLRDVVMDH
jgi:ATP/maltotriose-dependent transcriptional regulator MalT